MNGGLLYFYAAGTTTPQSAYQDSSLTIPWPNPIVLDSAGRVPPFYLADGQIKIRLTDAAGVVQVAADNLLVVGASSGSGSAPSVDATTILATGDLKCRYGTGALSGFVRANGRTIGSASSGGTERANADCQSLFEYLWTADANLSVSTGRGASANADWTANKNIALPDGRGLALAALDDMGTSARGVFTGVTFSLGSATALGSVAGGSRTTIVTANLPAYTPSGSISTSVSPSGTYVAGTTSGTVVNGAGVTVPVGATTPAYTASSSFTGAAQGGSSTPMTTMTPSMLITIYMKL